ncbi:LssY C-terminal domain-containing protein [Hippea maritima]|uniref:Phosphoesterase PA-phosphatase related protein n=1 Tax=Hippea maritima (strain ATCC 700847 / DSM 10411 / MH2) TaxID=760142 RepID=F2LXI1_HIPMA|nr:LssY C-terminal domain-containing protein [Hippea maritima]AEA33167.1 phosphoesterase PA-phosphatase related protein [Hippea maritima DSM 10411]
MHLTEIFNNYIVPYVVHLGILGYWIAALATLLETILVIGLFIPGSTIVLIFGALSAAGYYNFLYLMAFTVSSAVLGDYINYKLGKKYGKSWIVKEKWFLKKSHLEKGKRFFDSYGARSLSIGRLIPGLKETFPFIAGSMDTKLTKFLFWDVIGAIAWSFEFLSAGYLFGSSINLAKAWLGRITIVIAIIFFIFAVLYAFKFFFVKYGSYILALQKSIWNYLKTNSDILRLIDKYPKLFGFLNSRLTLERFNGLPLTILSLSFVYLFSLFIETTSEIIHKNMLYKFDIMFSNLIYHFRNVSVVKIMLFITMFGNKKTIIVITAMSIILFLIYRKRKCIFPLFVSIVGSTATTWSIKFILHRPRPLEAYYSAVGYSFPSGHATISAAFYGFLTYFYITQAKKLKSKFNIAMAGLAVVILIGASRIYLDVHYFSDVWAGYLIGSCWLIIAIGICEFLNYKNPENQFFVSKKEKYTSYAIILLSLTICAIFAVEFNPKSTNKIHLTLTPTKSALSVFKNSDLRYTTTILGEKEEPINLIIIAKNDYTLKKDMSVVGWYFADKLSLKSIKKSIIALIHNKPYNEAPISPGFWNYKVNNFGIEKPIKGESIKLRHHGRIWKTYYSIEGEEIYVAAVSFDTRLKWVIHKINPNIDKEREFFFNSLRSKHLIEKYKKIQFVEPFSGYNFYGDKFFTDGKAYIIWLK